MRKALLLAALATYTVAGAVAVAVGALACYLHATGQVLYVLAR